MRTMTWKMMDSPCHTESKRSFRVPRSLLVAQNDDVELEEASFVDLDREGILPQDGSPSGLKTDFSRVPHLFSPCHEF